MTEHNDLIREAYAKRADRYDSKWGWHADLADDFVKWLDPKPGEFVLDLACGTGLVTRPLAARVGIHGRVVAVDLTEEMIRIATNKETQTSACEIDWVVADITSETLLGHPSIRKIVEEHSGFDVISLCSALVLLPNQHAAVAFWTERLLKKGGRIIVDVPTESITVQFLMTYHLPKALGRSVDLSTGRLWITGKDSLEDLFRSVGLEVEQSLATRSYDENVWYTADKDAAIETLREHVRRTYRWVEVEGKLADAEQVWPNLWEKAVVVHNGVRSVDGGHRLYVCVGRKAA